MEYYLKRPYYFQKYDYPNIDIYSGGLYSDVFEWIDGYSAAAESDGFKFLVDVYKENY